MNKVNRTDLHKTILTFLGKRRLQSETDNCGLHTMPVPPLFEGRYSHNGEIICVPVSFIVITRVVMNRAIQRNNDMIIKKEYYKSPFRVNFLKIVYSW